MELEITLYLEDKNNDEQEINVLIDFDGDVAKDCDGYNATPPSEENVVVVSAEFAGVEWPGIEILLENHFVDHSKHTVQDMILKAVTDKLNFIYETKFC